MAAIKILDDQTINQIAAGEVIENPASVIKELVENAIDAEARKIIVEIKRGGFQEIKITDDGKGMDQEDLSICLQRHATSKIRKADDLQTLLSMGFRGEALASIAAVSKVRLTSSADERGIGHELYSEGCEIKFIQEIARKRGTTVTVSQLFYNVPARKKFQKTERASQNEILKTLTHLALAHPELDLTCIVDQEELFSSYLPYIEEKKERLKELIEKILGSSFLIGSTSLLKKEKNCTILGYIGAPHQARKNRTGQYLIVNGRSIQSSQIVNAIYEGYGSRLPSKEHPTFVLHMTFPADWIDVNVHPQKKEIRLREETPIETLVRQAVFKTLQGEKPAFSEKSTFQSWTAEETELLFREGKPQTLEQKLPLMDLPVIGLFNHYLLLDSQQFDPSFSIPGHENTLDGLLLLDLKAAEERLTYEVFLSRFEGKGELQTLLFPLTFECSKYEKGRIDLHLETFQTLGVSIRPFGEMTYVVDAIDPHFDEMQIESFIHEFVEILDQTKEQKKLAQSAVRFARSKQDGFSLHEARALALELLKAEAPFQSPIGKPTFVHVSQDEIKKYFR